MPLPDDIAADLPPPRDDEPESLRQNIVDELADHLASALDRERQREETLRSLGGTTNPWQRVLNRFGNPSVVALQLWREALQERSPMQRILSAMGIATLGVICVGMFLIVRSVNRQQEAMLVQQRDMAEILQQLSARAERPAAQAATAPTSSIEWVPVEISLSAVAPGKKLPAGFAVRISMESSSSSMPPWSATTDDSSKVRFPIVHYGRYTLLVEAPWGEYVTGEISVSPGTPLAMTILCPDAPPEPLTVKPELVLPEDLRQRPLHVLLTVGAGRREFGGWSWITSPGSEESSGNRPQVLIGTDGQIRPFSESAAEGLKHYVMYDEAGALEGLRWPDRSVRPVASVQFRIDRVTRNSDDRLLYLMRSSFEVGRDVRFEITADGRLRVEPTEPGLEMLRTLLAQFDKGEEAGFRRSDGFVQIGSAILLPPIPDRRP